MAAKPDESWPGTGDGFARSWRALIGNAAFWPSVDYQGLLKFHRAEIPLEKHCIVVDSYLP